MDLGRLAARAVRGGHLEPVVVAGGEVDATTKLGSVSQTPDGLVLSGAALNL